MLQKYCSFGANIGIILVKITVKLNLTLSLASMERNYHSFLLLRSLIHEGCSSLIIWYKIRIHSVFLRCLGWFKKEIKNTIYFKYHLIFVDVSIQSRIVPLGITRQDKYGDLGCFFGVLGGSKKEIKNTSYFKYHLIFVDVSIQFRIVPLGITRQDKYGDLGCFFGVLGGSKK